MAAFVAGGTLFQWPLGRWSDSTDRRIVIAAVGFGAAVPGLSLAYVPFDSWALALAVAMLHCASMHSAWDMPTTVRRLRRWYGPAAGYS